ncbi:hypothetical protein RDI58_028910 [Solanum bulbocastanum]|uniref:Uncharacterized protein n=1 Tax=Solanum bulbocastanum TaxID=147425 RepID=A0AAN8SVU9_SOLBU
MRSPSARIIWYSVYSHRCICRF